MNNYQSFKIAEISDKFHSIIDEVKNLLKDDYISNLDYFDQKVRGIDNNKVLSVAFIGQYSSGKSTIISALTNNQNIKIDSDIATYETTEYKWNDIILVDTPGIYTDRKDHDEITNTIIQESDLLVFCLTSDLFDDIILENFKKLAFSEGYKDKMLMVINKMSMESGEYSELVKNYKKSLINSLKPYNLEDFNPSFIDAADYIEGKKESEEDLIEMSHFNDFIENLNLFINEKGILGKLDSPIRLAISAIDNIILELSSKDDKELFQHIERIEYEINKNKEKTEALVKQKIEEIYLTIIRKSNELTDKIGDENFNLDEKANEANINIEARIQETRDEIQQLLEEQTQTMNENVAEIIESDLGQYVMNSIYTGKINLNDTSLKDFTKFLSYFDQFKKQAENTSGIIGKMTNTDKSGLVKASQVSGSQAHKVILNVGHYFGHSFKPWQAVNLAKSVGNATKFLGPAVSVVSLFLDINEAVKEHKNAKKIADAQKQCYNQFLSIASDVEKEFNENFDEFKKESYIKILDEIRDLRNNILTEKKLDTEITNELNSQKENLENLIKEIYA